MKRWVLIGVVLLVMAGVGAGGYALGALHGNVALLTGKAYVGLDEATVIGGDSSYGVTSGVPWENRQGDWVSSPDEMPGCLRTLGWTAPVEIGVVQFPGPTGVTWDEVVWVVCSGGPDI